MKPIYKPKGAAKEYGDLAINVFTGCNHRCTYCYAPLILKRDREKFHSVVEPRKEVVEAAKRQINKERITGKLIHLCFCCDPYPAEVDTNSTRKIIKTIKESGNNVQILTKGGKRALRDFDLLDGNDWFGVTITGGSLTSAKYEPNAAPLVEREESLKIAHNQGIKTWVSFEPVLDIAVVYRALKITDYVDLYRIGKLNYVPNNTDWAAFGTECERIAIEKNLNYYIKDGLRKIMNAKSQEVTCKMRSDFYGTQET